MTILIDLQAAKNTKKVHISRFNKLALCKNKVKRNSTQTL